MPSKGQKLSQPLLAAIRRLSTEMSVSLPGRVERYDYNTQKAEVKPLINRQYADGTVDEMPVIASVPVVFPRSGGASLTMPVKRGDGVLLVFADRSIDTWLERGGQVTPDDRRQHALSDCVAVVGLYSFADASPAENNDDVLLQYNGSQVRLKPGGNVEIESASTVTVTTGDVTINCDSATINSPDNTINGDLLVNGSVTWSGTAQGKSGPASFSGGLTNTGGDIVSDGISLENHTHTGDSGGTTSSPN